MRFSNLRVVNDFIVESDPTHQHKIQNTATALIANVDSTIAQTAGATISYLVSFQGVEAGRWAKTVGGNALLYGGKTSAALNTVGFALNATTGIGQFVANGAAQLQLNNTNAGGGAAIIFSIGGTEYGRASVTTSTA